MRAWFDWIMQQRARKLTDRLRAWIPSNSRVADIGSGTGHNAQAWRTELNATVDEFDVSDLHWIGTGATLFDGRRLPIVDAAYPIVTLLFVLQYSSQAVELLRESRRISAGRVLMIQSTYRGQWGRAWLNVREFIWGPLAFFVARRCGILRGMSCPLFSRTLYSRPELRQLFQQAGLTVRHWEPSEWWGLMISRDLYVLEVNPMTPSHRCPSSSPPETKHAG